MIPHPIRLRHPWETEPAGENCVLHRRRFNRPTSLDAWERVTLEIDRVCCAGEARLNGVSVGRLTPGEYFSADVTSLLQPNNELCMEIDPRSVLPNPPPSSTIYIINPDTPLGSPVGDVQLVIRATHS
jgi:hypothetical protein